jgi:hypothetical protein
MDDLVTGDSDREKLLLEEYLKQTARIHWHDLQTYYAGGSVIRVSTPLDLVNVAVQLGMDNTDQFQQWIAEGVIAPVAESEALAWYDSNTLLWAVVASPWVLVQWKEEP